MIDLRALRASAGQTQAQVAERLGVTTGRVSQIEGGANITLATLAEYLNALTTTDGGDIQMKDKDPAIAELFDRLTKVADLIGEAHKLAAPGVYTGEAEWTLALGKVDGGTETLTSATAGKVKR